MTDAVPSRQYPPEHIKAYQPFVMEEYTLGQQATQSGSAKGGECDSVEEHFPRELLKHDTCRRNE